MRDRMRDIKMADSSKKHFEKMYTGNLRTAGSYKVKKRCGMYPKCRNFVVSNRGNKYCDECKERFKID